MNSSWKRAGIGVCTATAVALTAGLATAPAAQAAPRGHHTVQPTGLTVGVGGGATVNGTVTSLVNGLVGGTTATGAPVAVHAVDGSVAVGLGGSTVSVGLNGSGTVVPGSGGTTVGIGAGTTVGVGTGTTVGTGTGTTVGTGTGTTVGTGTGTGTGGTAGPGSATTPGSSDGSATGSSATGAGSASTTAGGSTGGASWTPAVTALRIRAGARTVYPVADGYRDSLVLHIGGDTASGGAQPVTGVVVIKRGATEVERWSISSTDEDLVWNGRVDGKVVPGVYDVTAVVVDATGAVLAATATVAVSGKRLVAASQTVRSTAVSGFHAMSAKPKAGLTKGRVLLRLTTTARGISGKQYLVFSHRGKHLRVRVPNGTHRTKAVVVPKSFTSYRISHTWKGTAKVSAVVYHYRYKKLK